LLRRFGAMIIPGLSRGVLLMCVVGLWRVASGLGGSHVGTMEDLQLKPFPVYGRRGRTKKVYASLNISGSLLRFSIRLLALAISVSLDGIHDEMTGDKSGMCPGGCWTTA
jgi:hypothetical protein